MIRKRIGGRNLEPVAWEELKVPELWWLMKRQRRHFILMCVQDGCPGWTKRQLFSPIFRVLLLKGNGSWNRESQAHIEKRK